MSEYRIDIMQDATPHAVVLASEHFTARTLETACRKGDRILRRLSTNPAQYGDLWVRDADGGNTAEYVDTIEATS